MDELKERALAEPKEIFMDYANFMHNMHPTDAELLWENTRNIGKKVICQCVRNDNKKPGSRLFIKNISNEIIDIETKDGWWDTFTISREKIEPGLYICEVITYQRDHNGYLNCIVKPVKLLNETDSQAILSKKKGVWNSSALRLMLIDSCKFIAEYEYSASGPIRNPNIYQLIDDFPVLDGLCGIDMPSKVLEMYMEDKVTIEQIERSLDTPTYWENLIAEVANAVGYGTAELKYGDDYPLFAKKVSHNTLTDNFFYIKRKVEDYIQRQLSYYDKLVIEGKIKADETTDFLRNVESALTYRKSLQDAEKAAKKEARKMKKAGGIK